MLEIVKSKTWTKRDETSVDNYAVWFGARLRDALGDTPQTDLAQIMTEDGLEVLPGRISHYMQGRRYPDPPILKAMVRALGVSADWVLGLTEQRLPVADLEEMLAQAKGEGRINKIVKQLPADKQQAVLDFAEYLLAQQQAVTMPDGLTQRQRDDLRARTLLESIDKEYGRDVRLQFENLIRGKGRTLTTHSP